MGDPEVLYGGEYFGEEFHGEDAEEHDAARLAWLAQQRSWMIDVFTNEHVYGRELTAADRLRQGFLLARASRDVRAATYVDLSR